MPRSFSDQEKVEIRARLIAKAIDSMERYGVRKSNVEWIAKATGISKGGFYLFYSAKEELLFDAFLSVQSNVRADLLIGLKKQSSGADEVRFFLEFLFLSFEKYPVLTVLGQSEELSALMRGIDPRRQKAESRADDLFFQEIYSDWKRRQIVDGQKAARMAGLPGMALALTLEKELIGTRRFKDTKSLLINGLVRELTGDGS